MENDNIYNYNIVRLPYENDVYIHHELNDNLEFMVNKISIIHGKVSIDCEDRDGQMDVISSKENWYNHWVYWYHYLRGHFKTDEFMQKWLHMREKHLALTVHCLDSYGSIILLDVTDLDEEEKCSMAMMFIPKSITEKQYKRLEKISSYLSSYKNILIQGGKLIENPESFFDPFPDLPIDEYIEGSTFSSFLKDTIKNYSKDEEIRR